MIEVPLNSVEDTPPTISQDIRELVSGVYKTKNNILSIIDVDKIMNRLAA